MHIEADVHVGGVVTTAEQRVERGLQVVEILVGQVGANAEPAEHEVRDLPEVLLRREDERDLVAHVLSPASRSSSPSSRSRRAAASLPVCTA